RPGRGPRPTRAQGRSGGIRGRRRLRRRHAASPVRGAGGVCVARPGVTEQGVYDLTFDRAQQLMPQRAGLLPTVRIELVTVRDPDAANAHTIFIDGQRRDVTVTRTGLRDTGMAASGDTGVAAQVRVVVC